MITRTQVLDAITKHRMADGRMSPQTERQLRSKSPAVWSYIQTHTAFLDSDSACKERIYCIVNNITDRVLCAVCTTNPVNYGANGYLSSCSIKCGTSNSDTKSKRLATNLQKYGCASPANAPEKQAAKVATWVANLGVTHPSKSSVVQAKKAISYGKEQRRETVKRTRESQNNTWATQSNIHPESLAILKSPDKMFEMHVTQQMSALAIGELLNVGATTALRWIKRHDIKLQHTNVSSYEHALRAWLTTHNIQFIPNDRTALGTKLELDFWIPSHNIAIEICGTYWHSELYKDRDYHLRKLEQAETNNIQLLQIYDSEIELKREIVLERLAAKLKLNKSTIQARKCVIRQVDTNEERQFLNAHHIQGFIGSHVAYGAFHNDVLIAVMSFGHPRYTSDSQWELLRFATIGCRGIAQRLFKLFVTNNDPTSIVSYSDRRWNTGEIYTLLGMEKSHSSRPNYMYFHQSNAQKLLSRVNFQKHKLPEVLKIYDSELSEWDNMLANNYNRIWDCGNDVFVWNKEKKND